MNTLMPFGYKYSVAILYLVWRVRVDVVDEGLPSGARDALFSLPIVATLFLFRPTFLYFATTLWFPLSYVSNVYLEGFSHLLYPFAAMIAGYCLLAGLCCKLMN